MEKELMKNKKPRLSVEEQIAHLKEKGVLFNIMEEDQANAMIQGTFYFLKLVTDSWFPTV